MTSTIRNFIFGDMPTIEGYLDPADALVFLSLLECQKARNLAGTIAEIGIFYGRSYFLLRKITAPENKVLAIDLFDRGPFSNGLSDQYRRFLDNGRLLELPVDESLVITNDSTKLKPEDITGKVGHVRFFSIDGGHTLAHVAADSLLAKSVLADHGVIVFDDTFNPAWPDVTVGVADFLRENRATFSAFCITKYKTYVCKREFQNFYRTAITQASHLTALEHSEIRFLGSHAVRLHNPIARRVLYELMIRAGMGAFSERAYR